MVTIKILILMVNESCLSTLNIEASFLDKDNFKQIVKERIDFIKEKTLSYWIQ